MKIGKKRITARCYVKRGPTVTKKYKYYRLWYLKYLHMVLCEIMENPRYKLLSKAYRHLMWEDARGRGANAQRRRAGSGQWVPNR